jgi:hypothetical protein
MKQLIRILIFLSFIFLITSAYCQWQTIQSPATSDLFDLSNPSPNLIWAVAVNDSSMVRTTNGGLNWVTVYAPGVNYMRSFSDMNTAWIRVES